MATLRLKLTLPTIPTITTPGLVERIRARFAQEAGQVIVNAVRQNLGTEALYDLKPEYAARKPFLKGYQRFPGKDADQPGILSGELTNSLVWTQTHEGLSVQVEDGKATDGGFDYAEWFEELSFYLEHGMMDVEDELPDLLLTIICEEMVL